MTILDDLLAKRADLYAQAETIQLEIDERQRKVEGIQATVAGLTIGIDALQAAQQTQDAPPAPVKAPRLDITRAVMDEFAKDPGPHKLAEIVAAVGRKPSQVLAAIKRLDGKVERDTMGNYVARPLLTGQAA